MIGKEFRVSVRVKACIGDNDWCKGGSSATIRPGMILLALNDTTVDRRTLQVTDRRGISGMSLRPLAALMKHRPLRALFLDPARLTNSFRTYLQRSPLGAQFRTLNWEQQKQVIFEYCSATNALGQRCAFLEYSHLLKNLQVYMEERNVQEQLAGMDTLFQQHHAIHTHNKLNQQYTETQTTNGSQYGHEYDWLAAKGRNVQVTGFYHLTATGPMWQQVAAEQMAGWRVSPLYRLTTSVKPCM